MRIRVLPGIIVGIGIGILGERIGWSLLETVLIAGFLVACGVLFAHWMEPVIVKWARDIDNDRTNHSC